MGLPFFEPIPDGVYQVDYSSWDFAQEIIHKLAGDGPFFVKRTDPEITLEATEEKVTGQIDDAFVDYMPTIKDFYGESFDLNSYLVTSYEIQDEEGDIVDDGEVELEQDGSFELSTGDLDPGEYTVQVSASDIALNSSAVEANIEIEEVEPLELTLSQTPTDETTDEVTIKVDVNKDNVTTLKWLAGERDAEDFADEGENIEIDTPLFTVTENGPYTVYAEDEDGLVALQTITVSNIKEEDDEKEDPDNDDKGEGDNGEHETDDPETDDPDTDDPDGEDNDDDKLTPTDDSNKGNGILPKTATAWYNYLLIGSILLVAGGLILLARRFENYLFFRN